MEHTQNPTVENLLAETNWLRALARHLVRDEAQVDDLFQDTVTAFIRDREQVRGPLRPWLFRVAKNLVGRLAHRDARRAQRERSAAAGEAQPSVAETAERFETHRVVVDVLGELEEPYHTTLLLRYWEDLPPREIAARMRVPVDTVKTRLRRGLASLRERLDLHPRLPDLRQPAPAWPTRPAEQDQT